MKKYYFKLENNELLEFNQFIRMFENHGFEFTFQIRLLHVKEIFIKTHKFNNAKNKIKLTNKCLFKYYIQEYHTRKREEKQELLILRKAYFKSLVDDFENIITI